MQVMRHDFTNSPTHQVTNSPTHHRTKAVVNIVRLRYHSSCIIDVNLPCRRCRLFLNEPREANRKPRNCGDRSGVLERNPIGVPHTIFGFEAPEGSTFQRKTASRWGQNQPHFGYFVWKLIRTVDRTNVHRCLGIHSQEQTSARACSCVVGFWFLLRRHTNAPTKREIAEHIVAQIDQAAVGRSEVPNTI
jgi:hypothetical protein